MLRRRRLLRLAALSVAVVVAVLYIVHSSLMITTSSPAAQTSSKDSVTSRGFLVKTPACSIPDLDPWDASIAGAVKRTGRIWCNSRRSVSYVDGPILRINHTYVEKELGGDFSHCKFQAISRPLKNASDFVFLYSDLGDKVSTDVEMQDEFVRIYCYSHSEGVLSTTFHAFILPKEEVERRCTLKLKKHLRQNNPLELLNVQMVGVDSVSRLNFMRQMPKTRRFLLHDLEAVEMLGYNKVADNTFVNVVPMTAGKFVEELPWNETMMYDVPFDNFTFIWKDFSNAGYRTLYAEDAPSIAIFVYYKQGFKQAPADYYNRALSLAMEKHRSVWNHDHHCIADVLETSMVLNYASDFSRLFSNPHQRQDNTNGNKGSAYQSSDSQTTTTTTTTNKTPHFGFSFITRLTHDNVNDAGRADEPHLNFLRRFRDEGYLNNTILIYFSDHGNRFGNTRDTYVGKAEERLPFLFLVFPPWFRSRYPRLYANLQTNRRRLTTPFDVYETLKDILYFDGQDRPASLAERGISLFRHIPEMRNCEHAHILPHWCMCLERRQLPVTSVQVQKAAAGLLLIINRLLHDHLEVCARLTVKAVHGAEQMTASEDVLRFQKSLYDVINRTVVFGNRTESDEIFQLTMETEPGGALFEATLRYSDDTDAFSLAGDISRINAYGAQSHCIDSFNLKKFCFCKMQPPATGG